MNCCARVGHRFDRETQERYQFLVTAADRAREPRTATATVNVLIIGTLRFPSIFALHIVSSVFTFTTFTTCSLSHLLVQASPH